jgi:hypothetical protein
LNYKKEGKMVQTDIFLNATQSLEQINLWYLEQEAREEKQKFLIRETNRKEQGIKESNAQQQ